MPSKERPYVPRPRYRYSNVHVEPDALLSRIEAALRTAEATGRGDVAEHLWAALAKAVPALPPPSARPTTGK